MGQNNYQGALQKQVGSGFNARSTADDVIKGIDLTGKIAIVTGGNAGIGLETVKTLAGGTTNYCHSCIHPSAEREAARTVTLFSLN